MAKETKSQTRVVPISPLVFTSASATFGALVAGIMTYGAIDEG